MLSHVFLDYKYHVIFYNKRDVCFLTYRELNHWVQTFKQEIFLCIKWIFLFKWTPWKKISNCTAKCICMHTPFDTVYLAKRLVYLAACLCIKRDVLSNWLLIISSHLSSMNISESFLATQVNSSSRSISTEWDMCIQIHYHDCRNLTFLCQKSFDICSTLWMDLSEPMNMSHSELETVR